MWFLVVVQSTFEADLYLSLLQFVPDLCVLIITEKMLPSTVSDRTQTEAADGEWNYEKMNKGSRKAKDEMRINSGSAAVVKKKKKKKKWHVNPCKHLYFYHTG